MDTGEIIVRSSVWLALLCYPAGPFGAAAVSAPARRAARGVWTLGCAAFLVHVASSFHVFHDWSHAAALRETARQTAELTGRASGAGLYLNYLFTALWVLDAAGWWARPAAHRARSRAGVLLLHGFFLFMIFNATVVFEDGATRVMGTVVTAAGGAGLWSAAARGRTAP